MCVLYSVLTELPFQLNTSRNGFNAGKVNATYIVGSLHTDDSLVILFQVAKKT